MKYFLVFFATTLTLIFCLLSCRPKPIKVNVTSAPPKLVVYSHVVPNQLMIVTLTKSFSALDGIQADSAGIANTLVSGATVQILYNNQVFAFSEISPGLYISFNEAFVTNETYDLLVIKDQDTVRASTQMMPLVNFTSIVPEVEKLVSDTNVYLNLSFQDIPNVDNYYMLNFYKKGTNEGIDGVNFFSNGSNIGIRTILLSDKEFDQNYSKRIQFPEYYHQDSIVVTLSNIQQKYYDYLQARLSGGSLLTSLNVEPITYPSNVIGGYGFFNAHFPDIRFYDLGEY